MNCYGHPPQETSAVVSRRLALVTLAVALSGLTGAHAQQLGLTVFAAASLKNALDAIIAEFERETGKRVTVSYAASSADLFISADLDWMDYLQQRTLIRRETRHNLLGNRLVLIAPADRPEPLELKTGALAKALGDGRLAVA